MKTKLMMTALAGVVAFSAVPVVAQTVGGLESVREVVYYNFNSAQSAEVETQMQKITDLANSRNARSVQVVCHTDTTGSAAYNQGLSERRAADVRKALIARGISSNIITSSGLGETSPLVPTGDNVKEQLNRRCEIDLQVDSVYVEPVQTYTQTETYTQPQTYTETVVEQAPYQAPTPIESTQQVITQPYQAPTPVTTTAPVAAAPAAPVATPYVPPVAAATLPAAAACAACTGISPLLALGGVGAAGAIGAIIADGDSNETELAAAETALAGAQADAAAAAQAQAAAETAAADAAAAAAQAQADAEAAETAQAAAEAEAATAEAAQAAAEADAATAAAAQAAAEADLANVQAQLDSISP